MPYEGPGFVDHHAHLLRVAAGDVPPYDVGEPESIAGYHRSLKYRGLTPMDAVAPPPDQPDLSEALLAQLNRAARLGLVQVTEAGMTDWAYLDALTRLRDRSELPVRVRLFVASGLADPKKMRRTGDQSLEIDGVKFYADGWMGPRTCALAHPFEDKADDGILFLDAVTLARRAEPFAADGWTLATHAIGDRAIESVLDAYDYVYGSDCAAARPRIEHAQVLRRDLVERMVELGVVACIQPGFAHSDRATATSGLGARRMETAYRWQLLLDEGVDVLTGSDFPIEPLSPLDGLEKLAELIGVETALRLMTDPAAGTTVLSDDPTAVDPEEISRIEVLDVQPRAA